MPAIPKRLDPHHLGRPLNRAEYDELVARTMTERVLEQRVAGLARRYEWRRYHTLRSKGSPAGFPDDVLVRRGRLLFLELKTEAGKTAPAQDEWLDDLRAVAALANDDHGAGLPAVITVAVIRPTQLLDGTLERLLA